ncbi:MAG: LysR family transcriptional regulator [Oceanospirillaceae bacterium]|nr:LysR family transcriptional regulator [Oceanospirillaceae bacterium]MCP5349598.1 LysR family transcriptional regulator [Oceanospirillaceae bacterium]
MATALQRMTLRQLEVFRAVCRTRSYSQAGEQMALTQPAVSLQMRQLESLVGQALFEYAGKQLYLTPAAEALLASCQQIFDTLGVLDMQLSVLQGSLQGELKIAVETSAKFMFPHIFAAFKKRYPEVSLKLNVAPRAVIVKRLQQGRDDFCVLMAPPLDMQLHFFPIMENEIVAVAAPSYLAAAQLHEARDLEKLTLIQREAGSGTRLVCDEFMKDKRLHFSQQFEIVSSEAIKSAVMAGLGFSFLPKHAVMLELKAGLLQQIAMPELSLRRSWCVASLANKRKSPVASRFEIFMREEQVQLAEASKNWF